MPRYLVLLSLFPTPYRAPLSLCLCPWSLELLHNPPHRQPQTPSELRRGEGGGATAPGAVSLHQWVPNPEMLHASRWHTCHSARWAEGGKGGKQADTTTERARGERQARDTAWGERQAQLQIKPTPGRHERAELGTRHSSRSTALSVALVQAGVNPSHGRPYDAHWLFQSVVRERKKRVERYSIALPPLRRQLWLSSSW